MTASTSSRPTLRDVAQLAGVSHMTASRVVRNLQVVSTKTRQRVQAAIDNLGYRADPALSALAAYRSRNANPGRGSQLAFLDCDNNDYSRQVLSGARLEAERLGYSIERFVLSTQEGGQTRLGRTLYYRGIQGLLIGPSQTPRFLEGWNWQHFTAVSLGALFHHPALNAVTTDYFDGASQALRHLREQGCRRIGFAVDTSLESRTAHRWLGGYLAHLENQPPLIWDGSQAPRTWARTQKLDGFITIHHTIWNALRRVPCVFLNEFECPEQLPHIVYQTNDIGTEGVRLIHHQLLNHDFGLPGKIKTVSLQARLVRAGLGFQARPRRFAPQAIG